MSLRSNTTTILVATILGIGPACKDDEETVVPVSKTEPAVRAAASFVHCVESGSSGCIRSGENFGGWDAFFLLGWLSDGSPTSILQALPTELQNHADPAHVQGRLVQLIERYQPKLRGAECDPEGAQDLVPLVKTVAGVAEKRLTGFGLWGGDMDDVVRGLTEEAEQGLSNGYIVRMRCQSDPYQVYVATAERGNRQVVVGITLMLPEFLSGEGANRDARGRERSTAVGVRKPSAPVVEGNVDPWLPIVVEEF
jgi:hypothetical protein